MTGVLLVDDAAGLSDLVGAVLVDVPVRQAFDLSSAVRMGREQPPDVILLDLSLGEEDGLEMFDLMAEDPELANIPVVVFSVHDSRFQEALAAGAAGCLRKPFKTGQLRATLAPYLDGSGRLHEASG